MNARNRPAPSQVCCPTSFSRQPPRIMIVDVSPPGWLCISTSLCEALDNFLALTCSLEGPCRLPLLSLYALNKELECLLPFVQVKGNLSRLRSCVEELRDTPGEGCIHPPSGLFSQAVKDSLLQFKQYIRHVPAACHVGNSCIEVAIFTSQPGQAVVKQLEAGLKDTDLGSLQRLLVVHISTRHIPSEDSNDWNFIASCSTGLGDLEEIPVLAAEIELQQVDNDSISLESVFKTWLHDQGGQREHLHLLLPPALQGYASHPVCLKCDMQERLLSPALLPGVLDLGAKTESIRDFSLPVKEPASHSVFPHQLTIIKALKSEGVCQSVLYGLPLIIRPTSCCHLDWDEMEMNHHHFHALCHTLRPSASLSLLLKPVAGRELLLPCHMPVSSEDSLEGPLTTIQNSLAQLEEDPVFNPLCLKTNLYQQLRVLQMRKTHPYTLQRRDQPWPPERPVKPVHLTGTGGRAEKGKTRATVAPLQFASAPKPF
ncbi:meiosis 1 arrest protein isoform X3 [Brienomyrus brachyistius]|uniref:meiosis 1 arrest protein isoform X3 n=1 Tax=Brienomyrus brachyistius TaxID=42636 RepID=UPI0020B3BC07|nr:meiosis 1 arrest protein isoform X3 [Brienomyrus brachyistius]